MADVFVCSFSLSSPLSFDAYNISDRYLGRRRRSFFPIGRFESEGVVLCFN